MKWYTDTKFWSAAVARSLRSAAQGAIVGIGEATLMQSVKWSIVFGSSLLMAITSILTSIAIGLPEYSEDPPEGWAE